MQKTNIEYLTHSWNPIAMRCTRVSAGCKNCWHLRMANRLGGNDVFHGDVQAAYNGGAPVIRQKELSAPLRRKKPARIGVQFMGDLFHESITNEQIAAVYGVMAASPQHTFLVLTKRPVEAASWYKWISAKEGPGFEHVNCIGIMQFETKKIHTLSGYGDPWPLPNVWLGVSVEDQETADERIPTLLQIPAAKRFVSIEPMLGAVDIGMYLLDGDGLDVAGGWPQSHPGLDWCIVGCESGPGARECKEEWVRSVKNQCVRAGVPLFLKQMVRNGKTISNPELDGRVWNDFAKQ